MKRELLIKNMKFCQNQIYCIDKLENYKLLFESNMHGKKIEFRECKKCGLIYHYPTTTEIELREHYTNYGVYSSQEYFEKELINRRMGYLRKGKKLLKYFKDNKTPKLLEVGCANGIEIYYMQQLGFDCYGQEIDSHSSALAQKLVGENRVYTGFLENSAYMDESFDIVICSQVIEHVPNPDVIIKSINKCLKKGGILAIDTPNFGGPSFKLLKDKWKNTMPGDHISMFTPRTLSSLLAINNFIIIEKRVAGLSLGQRRNPERTYEIYNNFFWYLFFAVLGRFFELFRIGDGLAYICKKQRITMNLPKNEETARSVAENS